jgi:hypothetical protein
MLGALTNCLSRDDAPDAKLHDRDARSSNADERTLRQLEKDPVLTARAPHDVF